LAVLRTHLTHKREQKVRLIDLFGLLNFSRVKHGAERLCGEFFRGAIYVDAAEK